jgi:integrase
MRTKLTKTVVDRLQPGPARYDVIDEQIRGFIVRVNIDGTKTAILRYRRDGRNRAHKLGVIGGGFTVHEARRQASNARAIVDAGGNPARERDVRRAAPTFAAVAERYMSEVARPYRKASTVRGYEGLLRVHLLPALGDMKIGEITRDDVQRLHQRIGESAPGAANRALALVSVVMTNAERWELRDSRSNPCHRMEKFAERKMERFLSADERARLDAVLAEGEASAPSRPHSIGPATVAALRLLLMTGARLGEITGLRWSMVDLERSCLRLPDSKTGAKVIPLSPPAVAMLRTLDAKRSPGESWVCPCKRGGGPLQNLEASWRRVRARAGLDDVRLHDLRHSAASDALAAGVPLALIGGMLGHKRPETTARYAHLADTTLREAVRVMGEAIERSTREGAERLRQQAVGAEGGDASEGSEVIASDGGAKVIALRPRGKR